MNYFRCTVGGSGKGNTVTVTCAEEFAGLTITLAKTGKTYTKTCPSTSPYVVTFNGVENGTYTVSTTYDGQTYSETVIVQDISCVLNYGFTWRLWVDTASQLDSSDYDTLDEVLADEKALRELFLEHACVDYMASVAASNEDLETIINDDYCAKWINNSDYALDFLGANTVIKALMDEADKYGYGEWALMPQIPKMTSNTAPYGTASASTQYSTDTAPWKAFNRSVTINSTDRWAANAASGWIQYQFTSATTIKHVDIVPLQADNATKVHHCTLKGSNDGTNFVTLTTFDTVFYANNDLRVQQYDVPNNNAYTYYRLEAVNDSADGYVYLVSLQLYAWAPKGNVPVMTANNAPYGTAKTTVTPNTSHPEWHAFDDNLSTSFLSNQTFSSGILYYRFASPIIVKKYRIFNSGSTSARVSKGKLVGSNDGTNWTPLTDDKAYINGVYNEDLSDNTTPYLYYGISFTETGTTAIAAVELQFYGRELKVSVPVMTSNTAPFGECNGNFDDVAYKAFDGATTTQGTATITTQPKYLGYTFPSKVCVKAVQISAINNRTTYKPWHMQLKGSDDNYSTETLIDSLVGSNNVVSELLMVNNSNSYKGFRLYIQDAYNGTSTSEASSNYCNLDCLQFYGLDYSEKEFESGVTKKWLYDHGVDLVELEAYKGSTTTSPIYMNDENELYIPYLTGTNNSYSNYNVIGKTIDLSDYSLFRAVLGTRILFSLLSNVYYSGALVAFKTNGIPSAGTYNDSNMDAIMLLTLPIATKDFTLNISSLNEEKWISLFVGYQNVRELGVTELWLE